MTAQQHNSTLNLSTAKDSLTYNITLEYIIPKDKFKLGKVITWEVTAFHHSNCSLGWQLQNFQPVQMKLWIVFIKLYTVHNVKCNKQQSQND